ncbi:hypothetical protein B484DRAFT_404965 [Ochromonadaceae sp. CCMP2298]|nr:hypothetical protein B484DRAFT_404965 [Ochromonadaceae sp. CCMP2298]
MWDGVRRQSLSSRQSRAERGGRLSRAEGGAGGAGGGMMFHVTGEDLEGVELGVFDVPGGGDLGAASMSASFQHFVSNLLPLNLQASASTMRVDPATETYPTYHTYPAHTGPGASTPGAFLGAPAFPAAPLLSDPRRSRFGVSMGGPGLSLLGAGQRTGLGGLRTSSGVIYPAVLAHGHAHTAVGSGWGGMVDAHSRRSTVSQRRRAVGPIVSDRRWGTDVGELEAPGSRLVELTAAVEAALGDSLEVERPKEPRVRAFSFSEAAAAAAAAVSGAGGVPGVEAPSPFPMPTLAGGPRDWLRALAHSSAPGSAAALWSGTEAEAAGAGGTGEMVSPPPLGGPVSGPDPFGTARASRRTRGRERDVGRASRQSAEPEPFSAGSGAGEESKEEGELQESKEGEEPSLPAASASSTSASASAAEEFSFREPFEPTPAPAPVPASASASGASAATPAQGPPSPAPSLTPPLRPSPEGEAMETEGAPETGEGGEGGEGLDGVENMQFLDSLPADLRQEVLLEAEQTFLQSLPASVRAEAAALREQGARAFQFQMAYDVPSPAPVPAHAAPTANAIASLSALGVGASSALAASASLTARTGGSVGVSSVSREIDLGSIINDICAINGPAQRGGPETREETETTTGMAVVAVVAEVVMVVEVMVVRASRAPVIASPSVAATESKEGEGEPSGVVEEKPLTVTLLEDRWQDPLPYSALLVGRLLRCLCSSNKVIFHSNTLTLTPSYL